MRVWSLNTSLVRPLSRCSWKRRQAVVTIPALSCPRCCSEQETLTSEAQCKCICEAVAVHGML